MLKRGLKDLEENGQQGDWCFLNDDTYMAIRFGERVFEGMTIIPIAPNKQGQNPWTWDGNRESPTLSPSILVHYTDGATGQDVVLWHGFMTAGKLVNA